MNKHHNQHSEDRSIPLEDQIFELAAACATDPHSWANVAYDWGQGELADYNGPREWQHDINRVVRDHLSDPATRFDPLLIAVASGHGIGKSAEMGMLINWALSTCVKTRVMITANTGNQLKNKTSPEIAKWQRLSITGDWFECQTMSIKARDKEHSGRWRCDFETWSVHNTQAFAGLHNIGNRIVVLFDEASEIDKKVWEVTIGAFTDEYTEIIWIVFGNPTLNTGEFRECFRRNKHRWVRRQIDSRNVEGTNTKFLNQIVEDNGKDSDIAKVRVRGMFPSASAKQFINTADVDEAFGRHLHKEQFEFAPIVIGVDPAWSGDDNLVIMMRQGLYSKVLEVIPKNDNDIFIAQKVMAYEDELKADAVFVDAGYGTGIVSAGHTWGRAWELVWFNGKPIDPGCKNKRSEIWKEMRDWLKKGGAIPNDQRLYDDLIGPEIVPHAAGLIQLESKEVMKLRGLSSPDLGDALAITFARPVVKLASMAGISSTNSINDGEYNPYG